MESLKEDREEEAGECLLAKDGATEEEEETTGEEMAEEHQHQKKRANKEEEDEEQASSCEHRRRRTEKPNKALQLTVNFSVVIGVAVSWACATQFRRSTMVVDTAHFYAPYAMVWFSTSFMLLCYPVFLLYVLCAGKQPLLAEHTKALEMFANQRGQGQSGDFSFRTFLWRVLLFLGLWTVINYAYAQSLGLISASAAASIMSANTAAVCLLGWAMLKEPFNAVKTLAVLFAIAGVIVVSLDAEFAGNPLGIALAVLSAACAAFYKVLFKLVHGSATLGQVSLFMSALGALNLVANAVPTLLLVYYGLDRLQWAHIPWAPLLGSAVLGLVFNFLVNFGIVLLDPLVISVGMIFGLPLSAVIDLLFRSMTASPEFVAGSTLISISFLLIAFPVDKALQRLCGGRREAKDDVEKDEEEGAKQKQKRSPNPID